MRYGKWFHQILTVTALAALAISSYWLAGRAPNVAHAAISSSAPHAGYSALLKTEPARPKAGEPVDLSFVIRNTKGATVRFLQFVHEKPLHLLIVSEDLAEFYHIHPEMQVDDSYGVKHIFPHGGLYRLYADYTPPGYGAIVEQFELRVDGPERSSVALAADDTLTNTIH